VDADGPHSITECGPKARTRFALSLSEAEDAHTLTVVNAEGSTLSGRLDRRVDLGFHGSTSLLYFLRCNYIDDGASRPWDAH